MKEILVKMNHGKQCFIFSSSATKLTSRGSRAAILKKTEKKKILNSQYLLMNHLILRVITKRSYIRVKWRGWLKEHIRQVMIWQLRKQRTLGMLHLGEHLLTMVSQTKHAHYTLRMGNKFGRSSRWKHEVLREIEDLASKKLGLQILWYIEDQRFPSVVEMVLLLYSQL